MTNPVPKEAEVFLNADDLLPMARHFVSVIMSPLNAKYLAALSEKSTPQQKFAFNTLAHSFADFLKNKRDGKKQEAAKQIAAGLVPVNPEQMEAADTLAMLKFQNMFFGMVEQVVKLDVFADGMPFPYEFSAKDVLMLRNVLRFEKCARVIEHYTGPVQSHINGVPIFPSHLQFITPVAPIAPQTPAVPAQAPTSAPHLSRQPKHKLPPRKKPALSAITISLEAPKATVEPATVQPAAPAAEVAPTLPAAVPGTGASEKLKNG